MKTDFALFHDQFFGVRALADNYGVEATPTAATNAPGVVFGAGDAIHFDNNRQFDATLLSKVKFECLVENTSDQTNGRSLCPNSVPD